MIGKTDRTRHSVSDTTCKCGEPQHCAALFPAKILPPSASSFFFHPPSRNHFTFAPLCHPLIKQRPFTSLLWSPVLSLLQGESLCCFLPFEVNAVAQTWFTIPQIAQEHRLTPPTSWHPNRNTAGGCQQ